MRRKKKHTPREKNGAPADLLKVNLLVDIQAKLAEGKGAGYARWAASFNLKQMANTLNYLTENKLMDYVALCEKTDAATARFHELSSKIKAAYKIFGVDAELLIDHAWGRESTTIADIKAYRPKSTSLSSGQVLPRGYAYDEGRVIVREMAEELALDMFAKGMTTGSISLYLSYSFASNLPASKASSRTAPTASVSRICDIVEDLYDRIRDRSAPMHRVGIAYGVQCDLGQQYDLFSTTEKQDKEQRLQRAIIDIRQKHGKNSVLRAMDLLDGARTIERHNQIGGHRA